jgi:HprK-related kinase A
MMQSFDWRDALRGAGLFITTGAVTFRVQSDLPAVAEGIGRLYPDFPVTADARFADFHVSVFRPSGVRRWIRAQAIFSFDGEQPFRPVPLSQALPMLEWGMNWCISVHGNQFLVIHAAAIERGGRVAILPGEPGAGKSTLTALLVHNGWRLLSDELTLINLDDLQVHPLSRPISLKNESIAIVRSAFGSAVLSDEFPDTTKGTVALMRPPVASVTRAGERAMPGWIIFPRFKPGAPTSLRRRSRGAAFISIADNAFNYSIHGGRGFERLADVVERCDCYDFAYSNLDEAIETFATLD